MFYSFNAYIVLPVLSVLYCIKNMLMHIFIPADHRLMREAYLRWGANMMRLCGARWQLRGYEPEQAGRMCFVGNHLSTIDIPLVLVGSRSMTYFMAKASLFKIPIFGRVMYASGQIPVNRSSARETIKSIDAMAEKLKEHIASIAVFPEGTRSKDGVLLPFKRGVFKIVKRVQLPLVPFHIIGTNLVSNKNRLVVRKGTVAIRFGEPIDAEVVERLNPSELCELVREKVLELQEENNQEFPELVLKPQNISEDESNTSVSPTGINCDEK